MRLMVVESPVKARAIARMLDGGWVILATSRSSGGADPPRVFHCRVGRLSQRTDLRSSKSFRRASLFVLPEPGFDFGDELREDP